MKYENRLRKLERPLRQVTAFISTIPHGEDNRQAIEAARKAGTCLAGDTTPLTDEQWIEKYCNGD